MDAAFAAGQGAADVTSLLGKLVRYAQDGTVVAIDGRAVAAANARATLYGVSS